MMRLSKHIPRYYNTLPLRCYLLPRLHRKASSVHQRQLRMIKDKGLSVRKARVGLRLLLSSISDSQLSVGVQAYSCYTVFQAIRKAGHDIVFLDLNEDLKLDLDHLKSKISQIDVLIITHTYGYPEDLNEIRKVTGNTILLEDCSHSFLSRHNDQYTGTAGDAAIFSTGFTKFPPVGIGGYFVVNNPEKFPKIESEYRKIPTTPLALSVKDFIKAIMLYFLMKPLIYRIVTRNTSKWLDAGIDLGTQSNFFESKGNAWANKIFNGNLAFYEKMLIKQHENAKILAELINLKVPALNIKNSIPNYYMFPILIDERDDLFNRLVKKKIEAAKHWHKSLEWASNYGYIRGECPTCERLVDIILTLPTHYGVRRKDLNRITTTINERPIK